MQGMHLLQYGKVGGQSGRDQSLTVSVGSLSASRQGFFHFLDGPLATLPLTDPPYIFELAQAGCPDVWQGKSFVGGLTMFHPFIISLTQAVSQQNFRQQRDKWFQRAHVQV